MNCIHVGTSGFSYKDWLGSFYPGDITPGNMLTFYARHFDSLELNVTYYTIPPRDSFASMAQKVPQNFRFMVKVHGEVTHQRQSPRESMRQLIYSSRPLAAQGKLAGFLAQFPFSFKNSRENRNYLSRLKEMCGETALFVEFRHVSWVHPAVEDFLGRLEIGYVNVDEPPLKGLLPPQSVVTGDVAYVRLHGRNMEKWWQGRGAERYDYLYGQSELETWLIRIKDMLKAAHRAYVFFNNHPGGKAPSNALLLKKMLEKKQ